MKNFFKKLSFVLASAMVITSLYAPAATSAAAKDGILLKGKSVKTKGIFVGGDKLNFDYKIGKHNNKGADGKWSVSDSSVIKVNKHGVVTAVGTGEATLMLKVKKNTKKGIKKNMTFKVTINAMARASKLEIPASDKAISIKVGEKKDIMPVLTNKVDGVDSTYNLFAKSSDDSVATVMVDGKKVTVEAKMASATPATITVFAAQKNDMKQAWDNKYKVEDSFTVMVKGALSADQTAANKITVKGANLTAVAKDYEVKDARGNAYKFKDPVVVNAEKTEAVLEYETAQIPAGKYTLKVGENTIEFDAAKAFVKEIKLNPEESAILYKKGTIGTASSPNNSVKGAKVYYKLFDQFGNDVTNTHLNSTNIQVTGSDNAKKVPSVKGMIEFTPVNDYQIKISKVSLSIVDITNPSANLSKVLTVEEESRVSELEYKGIFNIATRKFEDNVMDDDKETNKLDNYRLLFTAKDQYGEEFYDATHSFSKYAAEQVQVSLLGATGLVAESGRGTTEKYNGQYYLAYPMSYKPTKAGDPIRAGKVSVQAIAIGSGKVAPGEFEVVATTKVDTLTIEEGVNGVYDYQENVLKYTALDVNGKPITSWSVLKRMNEKFGNQGIYFTRDDNGKVILVCNLNFHTNPTFNKAMGVPDNLSITKVVSVVTETNKFVTARFDVRAQRYPVAIVGIDKGAAKGITRVVDKAQNRASSFQIGIGAVKFQDQFGNPMSADDVAHYNATNTKRGKNATLAKLGAVYSAEDAKFNDWVLSDGNKDKVIEASTDEDQLAPEFSIAATAAPTIVIQKNASNQFVNSRVVVGTARNNEGKGWKKTNGDKSVVNNFFENSGNTEEVDVIEDAEKVYSTEVKLVLAIHPESAKDEIKNDYKFNIYNVSIELISGFAIDDIHLQAAKDLDSPVDPNKFSPSAYGMYAGEKIALVKGLKKNYEVYGALANADDPYVQNIYPPVVETLGNAVEGEDTVKVTIIKKNPLELTKTYKYSRAERHVKYVSLLPKKTVQLKGTGFNRFVTGELKDEFAIADQYKLGIGHAKNTKLNAVKPTITFSDYDNDEVEIEKNGSVDAGIKFKGTTGFSTLRITIDYPGSGVVFDKTVVLTK